VSDPTTLASFTSPSLMIPNLRNTGPEAVISELTAVLQQEGRLENAGEFREAVMARELMSPTAIALGWALPHARLGALPQLSFSLGRSSRPVPWFGESRPAVRIIFLFAVPEAKSKTYLDVVSAVARLTRNEALVSQLQCAPNALAMFRVLQQAPLRPTGAASAILAAPRLQLSQTPQFEI
jgi:mannitol/fructose-specific phosphotransferase system IIA component (Ntr-type)